MSPRRSTLPFRTPGLHATSAAVLVLAGWWGGATPSASAAAAGGVCSVSDTTIGAVQGSGETSPEAGRTVTVQGTVVADDEGPAPALRGFYLQDGGDVDPATSDGVFVFNGNADSVSVGQVVQVTGVVSEYQGQTEITVGSIEDCGTTAAPAPTDVTLPLASATALERYEGMLVRFPQELTVTEMFQLGRFGQVVVSSGGRLRQPTQVYPAADPRAAQLAAANALDRLIIDDSLNNQNPDPIAFGRGGQPLSASNTLRGGDTVTGATGVLTYTWAGNSASGNAYRLRPINSLGGEATFTAANERPTGTPAVGGTIKVASANLLNFFDTFTGCTGGVGGAAIDCRGASDATEYQRQLAKEVAALTSLRADVVGVMELENDGYGPTSSIQALVDALNVAEGPGTWAFVDPDAATGMTNAAGTDAIRTALLYRPASVSVVPGTVTTDRAPGAFERNPVAATFATRDGEKLTVVSNHFKSKGSCPAAGDPNADAGDGQGCWNLRRTQQATELVSWLHDTVIPAAGDPDVVVLGDLNAYAQEDPVAVLAAAGYVDLGPAFSPEGPSGFTYSYAFDGQWGTLDHVLASASLRPRVTGADEVHINADEPSVLDYTTDFKSAGQLTSLYAPDRFRTSDHDPVVVGLDLAVAPVAPKLTGAKNLRATVGTAFSYAYPVSGTPAPVVRATGPLPAGLTLSEAGVLAGVPQVAGTVTLTVTATNAAGEASVTTSLTVAAARSTTKVTAVPKAPTRDGRVVLSAKVTSAVAGITPTGSVTFTVNGAPVGAVALVGGIAATPPIEVGAAGVLQVVAVYSGSPALRASTGRLNLRVT